MKPGTAACAAAFVIAAAAGACAIAAPVAVGTPLPPLGELRDQHGAPATVAAPATRRVVFAADKAAADLASAVLAAQPRGVLQRQQAVYIADVSGMPGFVFRMFALPKLRDLPFSVALVQEASVTADLPRQAGRVTVLQLDASGTVTQVAYAADAATLLQALGVAARE